ncbi:hypothetical protein TUZN_0798 [Thermoproteus uzoniensis 768-20]|uniref:Uncharacterized protein n=1 Tax=Thermoproteus uzoniensis (strain 768-20) TaxID=999630 RepID=F2L537_THEU7|nr:hypothetical protein [Thermoproteus uzoniensis]AEA12286.1 hypothetical protein TUZN_0798 [Thermoproteus uzoniensis 768-20]
MKFYADVVMEKIRPKYVVATGLVPLENTAPGDSREYLILLGVLANYAELVIVADVADLEQVKKSYVYQAMNENIIV